MREIIRAGIITEIYRVQACKKNGKFEGECREWYENRAAREYGFYRNGKQEGEHKIWHENGQIMRDELYQNGLKEGISMLWYKNESSFVQTFIGMERFKESVYIGILNH